MTLTPTFKRLVGKSVGCSFRESAQVRVISTQDLLKQQGPSDVIIKVKHAGINGGCETFRVRGEFAFAGNQGQQDFPLGAEGVGVVVSAGPRVRGLKEGDAVSFVGGAYSELVLARGLLCTKIPDASPEYAALTISGTTAVSALEAVGRIEPSDVVLVTAAAGGTGHFAAQLAKTHGCHVVATAGGQCKADYLRSTVGVDRVIDHTVEDPAAVLAKEYGGALTLVFEGVGGRMRRAALENLHPTKGRLLNVGYIAEYPHNSEEDRVRSSEEGTFSGLPPSSQLFWSNQNAQLGDRKIFGNVWPEDRALVPKLRQRAFELYQQGSWTPLIDQQSFRGVESVQDAVDYMLSGKSMGKVIASFDLRSLRK